jgi:hypothetical protein
VYCNEKITMLEYRESAKKIVVLGLVTGGMDMNLYMQAEYALLNRFCVPL